MAKRPPVQIVDIGGVEHVLLPRDEFERLDAARRKVAPLSARVHQLGAELRRCREAFDAAVSAPTEVKRAGLTDR